MKTKFSVGNRINHYKFGEGMIIQIRNNQMEVLFLDEQRRSFSMDTDEVVMIGTPVFEAEIKEQSIPSASNKIKKELDQLKEGNRTEYFDYELNNQNKKLSLNKNTRVFHTLLGEGMITKILKNEYQIIFLNGDKHNIPINSPDLKLLTIAETKNETNESVENNIENNVETHDLFIGKHINMPNIGEGMVSKIFDETYEVIFLDGHKQSFILPDKSQNIEINTPSIIPYLNTTDKFHINTATIHFDEKNLFVGKQINHPEFGDGMISKLGDSFYEIIFLNGKKHRFEFADKNPNLTNPDYSISEPEKDLKRDNITTLNSVFLPNDLYVGKQINHPEFGEGMVSKILKNSYEIIFLNGKKQSFTFTENKINFVEPDIETKNPIFDKSAFELPIEKSQQNTGIKYQEITTSEIDDLFEKPIKTVTENARNKFTSISDITLEIKKNASSNILIGTAVLHPKHGNGLICNIDEFEIEVVFYNHKKIVYSVKNNELKYLNIK